MDALVTQQEDLVNTIEASAAQVAGDTEAGYVGYRQYHMLFLIRNSRLAQTEKAVKYAMSARRKRWICFFIFLIILAIIGVAVGVTVSNNKHH